MSCDCHECQRFREQPIEKYKAQFREPAAEPVKDNNPVDYPSHYAAGKIEIIDFIEDQKLPFHLGNVVKYVARSPHRGHPLEDLKKARWYLDRFIANLEKGQP